ncbi:hypothetical protein [Nocardia sp. NBC_01327]|uniref:hypothetical protein n=1 Tax=Nocardia sp. NBC_01327 TaxID=2903593 RepID=UPI002E0FCCDA|nr:hypothetical protein OG326_21310 [Nocardia sp. NBC_01327]
MRQQLSESSDDQKAALAKAMRGRQASLPAESAQYDVVMPRRLDDVDLEPISG